MATMIGIPDNQNPRLSWTSSAYLRLMQVFTVAATIAVISEVVLQSYDPSRSVFQFYQFDDALMYAIAPTHNTWINYTVVPYFLLHFLGLIFSSSPESSQRYEKILRKYQSISVLVILTVILSAYITKDPVSENYEGPRWVQFLDRIVTTSYTDQMEVENFHLRRILETREYGNIQIANTMMSWFPQWLEERNITDIYMSEEMIQDFISYAEANMKQSLDRFLKETR